MDPIQILTDLGIDLGLVQSLHVENGVLSVTVYATFTTEDGSIQGMNFDTPLGQLPLTYKASIQVSDHAPDEPISGE